MAGSPSVMPYRIIRGVRQRMSGFELSILLVGAIFFLLLFGNKRLPNVGDFSFLPYPDYSLWIDIGYTVSHIILALLSIGAFSLGLGGLACKFFWFRRILAPALSVAKSIPGIGLIGVCLYFFSSDLTIVFIAAFNVIWAVTSSILEVNDRISTDIEEVATGFRLTEWQYFWRIQIPAAIPSMVSNISHSMPGVWFRLICAEGILTLMQYSHISGCGGIGLIALEHRDIGNLAEILIILVTLVLLVDQCFIRPMKIWGNRYSGEIRGPQKNHSKSWFLHFWRRSNFLSIISLEFHNLISRLGNIRFGRIYRKIDLENEGSKNLNIIFFINISLVCLVYFLGKIKLEKILLGSLISYWEVLNTFILLFLFWMLSAFVLYSLKNRVSVFRFLKFFSIFPVIIFYPFLKYSGFYFVSLFLFIGTYWLVGEKIFLALDSIPNSWRQMAINLHVKGLLLWKKLIFPSVISNLLVGLSLAAVPMWDFLMIAESFASKDHGLGRMLFMSVLHGTMENQIILLMTLTALLMFLERFILQPIITYTAQKYTIR
ncbi:ABC transporter permease subunit [Swingsia samuiensis]|nr:ABC transporter permease subunit [Swingsia samuiensis]